MSRPAAPVVIEGRAAIADLRVLARQAEELAAQIREAVRDARRLGYGWPSIAQALRCSRQDVPLGSLFPGGTSETTIRRTYERGW